MKAKEIQRIAEAAKPNGENILSRWLPGGKKSGKEYQARNPHRDDQHLGSLSVEIASGKGGDFATGDTFGDYVGLVAFVQQCDQSTAAADLAEFLQLPALAAVSPAPTSKPSKPEPKWRTVTPVPEDAPRPPLANKALGKPDVVYTYRDAQGKVLGYVYRWNATAVRKKEFRPLTWCVDAKGRYEWQWLTWPVPRPLYGLDLIAARPDTTVVLHEGEKAADAGRKLMPDLVSICWSNGGTSADKTDYRPLKGRDVWLWPDHDEAGRDAMLAAAKLLKKVGTRSVQFINIALFEKLTVDANGNTTTRLSPLPEKWDCADAYAEGFTRSSFDHVVAFDDFLIDAPLPAAGQDAATDPSTAEVDAKRNGPYLLDPQLGLFYIESDKDGGVRQVRLCGPISVPALGRDADGGSWGPVIEFKDRDGARRREVLAFRLFLGDGLDGIKMLADLGLEIAPGRQTLDRLKAYIVGCHPEVRARLVDQTGWHGTAFLFPDGPVGEGDEILLFRGNRRAQGTYATRGSLNDWQTRIGMDAAGNPRLMFCLAVAFSGPLLKLVGGASLIFHWTGDSSIGKSGALTAAGSVWGSPDAQVHSWRQTSNALEYVCAAHNDGLLILDELKEVDGKDAAAIAYMLSNAKGKGRAHHAGGLREATSWRIAGLSSGELGMGDHLASAGQKHHAGQMVRFVELAADAGAGLGMWNHVGGLIGGGKAFTDILKKWAGLYHGTAGRAFVAELCKRRESIPALWRQHDSGFAEDYKPTNAGGQALRVMSAFSLVAFAGELAAKWGIVPWPEGAAIAAAGGLFEEWMKERPGTGNAEESQIIIHVRNVMGRTWQSKFVDWGRATEDRADLSRMAAVHDSMGFRKRDVPFDEESPNFFFYIHRERFASEFAAKGGFKPKRVAALLKARGVLKCDSDSTTVRETLPNGDKRSYCIVGTKLWDLEP